MKIYIKENEKLKQKKLINIYLKFFSILKIKK